jgi:hypothetical protein
LYRAPANPATNFVARHSQLRPLELPDLNS